MELAALLERRNLSVITREADYELARIQDLVETKTLVDGRGELEETLGRLLAVAARRPVVGTRSLDLIGHSTPGTSLLTLGDWVIDANTRQVTAFFRELAEQDVLPRLGIVALRLLGCETAETRQGRATMRALSDILGIEVYGTRTLIYAAHYDKHGFSEDARHVLIAASDLRRDAFELPHRELGEPYDRVLDIDALPALPLRSGPSVPCRLATADAARAIIRLVRRNAGLRVTGLLAAPSCEIALPSARPDRFHLAQVLFEGEYLRVYPDGDGEPGVVFPVEDPHALRAIVDRLPPV